MRKVSISASYDDDQGSSIDFDVSDSLLGTQGPRRVSRKRLRGFISRFTTSALWFFLAVAIAVITLESVYLVHVLRREETRLLGPSMITWTFHRQPLTSGQLVSALNVLCHGSTMSTQNICRLTSRLHPRLGTKYWLAMV